MSGTILGIETFWGMCLVVFAYSVVGAWFFWEWVNHDEQPERPWQWGDSPRRVQSFEAQIYEHIGGLVVGGAVVTLGCKGLGIW
jgi:hypothetical protein